MATPPPITSPFSLFPSLSPFQISPSLLISNPITTLCSLSFFLFLFFILKAIRSLYATPNTTKTNGTDFSPEIADALAQVNIFTASGDSVSFNKLWDQSQGVAVVALLRHFGCICSWELASTLKESIPRFESRGVKLIAIGIGEPKKAQILAQGLPFPSDSLYADPERKVYDLLGLYYGIGRTFFNRFFVKLLLKPRRYEVLQKAGKNYTLKATPDNLASVLQQGGMFVFKGKEIVYAWKDEGTGDHAPLDEIFDICCKIKNH